MSDARERLKGPHREEAISLVDLAHRMTVEDAERVEKSWMEDDDLTAYYAACDRVWIALEEHGLFLRVGWFEKEFETAKWMQTTRALHPVADAICATLVMNVISDEDYRLLTRHLKSLFQFA